MSSAELWSGGNYELVAVRLAEVHDTLVEARLDINSETSSGESETAEGVREPRGYLLVRARRR